MTGDRIDDATVEALLTGRRAFATEPELTAFTAALRSAGTRPGQPSPRLAAMLATGVFTEKGDLPATAASNVHGPAARRQVAGLPKWRQKKMAIETAFATMVGKFVALGWAAKAAAVSTVAVASIGGAGAAGALPEPLQQPFDRTVHSVIPDYPAGNQKPTTPAPAPSVSATFDKDGEHPGTDGRSYSPEDAGRPSGSPSWPGWSGADRPSTAPSDRPYTQPSRPAAGNGQRSTQPSRPGTAPQQPAQQNPRTQAPTQQYPTQQAPAQQYPTQQYPTQQAPAGQR
ncbi:hypothetical protein HC028_19770 [Planosporangium flavigriseum]|uniref:Uncharacterized protein n=1 Tax=Planosporangium flavigriseum TaxID=373681 RepID=A0A8J3PNG4_9ACTN|nr:hypothetical protein [Planosporangium flavigriseum]NJC66729.1 hypothetical protein [Planosporangium flavigriseum]GIG74883.1 hypothetical protein Pfl04_32870 [Planosporangium flavigriseum]